MSPEQTVNQKFLCVVLKRLRRMVFLVRPKQGWPRDAASRRCTLYWELSVMLYLTQKNISASPQFPYSPDLAPCDYSTFPKLKTTSKDAISAMRTPFWKPWRTNWKRFCLTTSRTGTSNVSGAVESPTKLLCRWLGWNVN